MIESFLKLLDSLAKLWLALRQPAMLPAVMMPKKMNKEDIAAIQTILSGISTDKPGGASERLLTEQQNQPSTSCPKCV